MYIKFFDWDKTRDTHGVYPDFNNVLNKLVDFRFICEQRIYCIENIKIFKNRYRNC